MSTPTDPTAGEGVCWLNEDCIAGPHTHRVQCRFPSWTKDAATPDADDASEHCDHLTTMFVEGAGWRCYYCGATVDPDASTDASEGLTEAEVAELHHLARPKSMPTAILAAVERIVAARESAAATRARAEGDRLRERIERLADAAEWRAETPLSRTFTGDTFGAWVTASDLRAALAPDTAGESA